MQTARADLELTGTTDPLLGRGIRHGQRFRNQSPTRSRATGPHIVSDRIGSVVSLHSKFAVSDELFFFATHEFSRWQSSKVPQGPHPQLATLASFFLMQILLMDTPHVHLTGTPNQPPQQHSSRLAVCHDVTVDCMTHRWVPVNVHSTPVSFGRGCG